MTELEKLKLATAAAYKDACEALDKAKDTYDIAFEAAANTAYTAFDAAYESDAYASTTYAVFEAALKDKPLTKETEQ